MLRKNVKTSMDALEFLIENTEDSLKSHSSETEIKSYTTVKKKKNGRKKGYQVKEYSIEREDILAGKVLEYTKFFLHGDVDNFSLKIAIGSDEELDLTDKPHLRDYTTIEAKMKLTNNDKEFYIKFGMNNINFAFNYNCNDKLVKRFYNEINKGIMETLKGTDKIN